MDVGKLNHWRREEVVPAAELLERISSRWPVRAVGASYGGEVAQRYAYADGQGEIGLITSVSQPFCGGCTRARLSSDGKLYTCLFASAGTDLRGVLRGGASWCAVRTRAFDADDQVAQGPTVVPGLVDAVRATFEWH